MAAEKKVLAPGLYASPFSKAYWRDAARELGKVRMLAVAAILIAVRVALKSVAIPIAPPTLMINLGFFVNALGAMIFGPVVAIIAAAISDTLGCILFPTGVYFFPFIFTEIAGSLIFALFLYRAPLTNLRVTLSRFCVSFFVNIVIQTPIMLLYYQMVLGKSYAIFDLPRICKNLVLFPIESLLLILFLNVITPLTYRMKLTYEPPKKLPKSAHGTQSLGELTSSTQKLMDAATVLFDRIIDPNLLIRRMYLVANHVIPESDAPQPARCEQLDLFTDYAAEQERRRAEQAALERERKLQQAALAIKSKYGKNALLKGMNLEKGATAIERNGKIGGHNA